MRFGDAALHCPPSPPYLSVLAHPLLPEHSQQDDAAISRYPVTDPHGLSREVKPKLARHVGDVASLRPGLLPGQGQDPGSWPLL
jgi:hypothetical protein